MFNKSIYPHQWTEYFTVFIPKPGRKDSLRPISLANNLLKIFEKMIYKRLEWWAENSSIFCNTQFGFRRGLSCIDNISTLITDIHISNKARKFTGVVFLDIMGAFDRVQPEVLIMLLSKYGLPSKILKFITALVSCRLLKGFAAGNNLHSCYTTIGLPQGSILSPILFNLYIALSHTVLRDSVKILYYADDIAIYCSDDQLESINHLLNIALDNLCQFFANLGLSFSPPKSSFMIFSTLKPRNLRILLNKHKFVLKINNENIHFSAATRFLGVLLDPELNWKAHINYLKNRITPRINILKAITGIRWGAHPANLLTIYKGYIRPILDWGSQAFNPLSEQLYLKASRMQYAALRTVSGLMITTPTNVLLDINGEFPLESRWHYLTLKFLCKIVARNSHPLCQTITYMSTQSDSEKHNICYLIDAFLDHSNLYEQIEHYSLPGYLEFPYKCRHHEPIINTDLGLQISADADISESFNRLTLPFKFEISYYTDGSRTESDNKVGYAVFSPETGLEYRERINNNNTIFEAEALAILYAINTILKTNARKSAIFSDSLSVISSLKNPAATGNPHHRIYQIRKALFECSRQSLETHIFWIPSHRGIPGNERADSLAKESLHLPDPFLLSKCHYTNLYSKFKTLSKDRASQIIQTESLTKGTRYFKHIHSVLSPP